MPPSDEPAVHIGAPPLEDVAIPLPLLALAWAVTPLRRAVPPTLSTGEDIRVTER